MAALSDILQQGEVIEAHRPWPRVSVSEESWREIGHALAEGRLTLVALWGEAQAVHTALLDGKSPDVLVASLSCPSGAFPSIGRQHAPAIRLERAIHDLCGLEPLGLPDTRPWLDHGRWTIAHPLGAWRETRAHASTYGFLPAEGVGLHQIPVGPVHAGIIEPGHFRFTASGETIVRLEARLGYVHKGIESLMAGAELERAARLAGRVSGDSTVAYAFAFARAVEAALQIETPPRAAFLRALMAELERLANHLGDIGAICNDAAFAIMHAHCAVLRERVLRAAGTSFGHRLMMDCVVPGGVSADLDHAGISRLRALIGAIRTRFPALIELYDNTASLQDRTVGAGHLPSTLARQYGVGGFVGRASGRAFDVRRALAYPPYGGFDFEVPVQEEGDVNARVWIRIHEVEQSLSLIEQILQRLPDGPIRAEPATWPGAEGEGAALVEGFRGDIWVWLRLGPNRRIERCHLRDPSWFQWPLLEAAIKGNIVGDFPLCNKSFNCSYAGHDL